MFDGPKVWCFKMSSADVCDKLNLCCGKNLPTSLLCSGIFFSVSVKTCRDYGSMASEGNNECMPIIGVRLTFWVPLLHFRAGNNCAVSDCILLSDRVRFIRNFAVETEFQNVSFWL